MFNLKHTIMKTKILLSLLFAFILPMSNFAQDKTTVRANSSDISDNLDLRAIASVFGEAKDLEDFENRINDPKAQLSNLDLNNDNYVDYLRVIESVEGDAHLIIIQSCITKTCNLPLAPTLRPCFVFSFLNPISNHSRLI